MSTYTPIASVTLSSAQSSVTFSGIPQTYTDLVVVFTTNTAVNSRAIRFRMNGDTSANYSYTQLYGTGSAAGSSRDTSTTYIGLMENGGTDNTANNYQPVKINIMNYSNTTTNKTVLVRQDGKAETAAVVGLYRSTSAITSLTLELTDNSNWSSGNTFNLYGVANASITNTAKATGGDTITTDGTYWYHTFYSSGTFTPTQALTADYLVVAGGGGGGGGANVTNTRSGGGGGAGGLRCTVTATGGGGSVESALSLTAQAYTVTVGAGGAAGVNSSSAGTSGSNSVFSSITATGGGGGGQANSDSALTGGSGGGGGTAYNGKAGTSNQGYAGGNGTASSNAAGGGGGAGAAGSNGTSGQGGNGGNGVATSISGSSVTYAGGGGGSGGALGSSTTGTGGTGGGGAGGYHSPSTSSGLNAVAGTTNTGGGGGGGSVDTYSGNPAAGGSGIVIVRYSAV
jgi:hypothetical protein